MELESLKQLPKSFQGKGSQSGWLFYRFRRIGDICIYQKSFENTLYFEVFKVRIKEAEERFGIKFGRREVYPSDEDFGKTAWCYSNIDEAVGKFRSLIFNFKKVNPPKQIDGYSKLLH